MLHCYLLMIMTAAGLLAYCLCLPFQVRVPGERAHQRYLHSFNTAAAGTDSEPLCLLKLPNYRCLHVEAAQASLILTGCGCMSDSLET